MLTAEQKALFEKWSREKRLISVVVLMRSAYFGGLENLVKPDDVALVAFVPECAKQAAVQRGLECFDLILYCDISEVKFAELQGFDNIEYPALEEFGDEMAQLVDLSKLQLIHGTEMDFMAVGRLRERLGIAGPYVSDLKRICDKSQVKRIANENNIPTAKSITVDFASIDCRPEILLYEIEAAIGEYPMFKRPILLAGCIGAEKIECRSALLKWIKQRIELQDSHTYLIEEYLTGREFLATVCLLADGTFEPLVVKYLEFGWSNVLYLKTGRPLPILVDSFYNSEREFPNLRNFVKNVIDVFKPPYPHVFAVQGYQRTLQTDDYLLVELSHRPAGSRTNSVCYDSCGVSQETALIMSHIEPNYRFKVDPHWKRPNCLSLWFPQRKGILESYTSLPANCKDNIKSEVTEKWLLPEGTVMEHPKTINRHMLILNLRCKDREQLLEDAKWIAGSWRPRVVELSA